MTESELARAYLEKATKRRRVLDVLMHENAYETVEHMPYVTSVERIGIRKGIRQGIEQATPEGLQHQRHMLTRQVQWRFGTDVAKDSRLLLADIADPQRLDDLAEVVLDSPDGACWLRVRRRLLRERPEFDVAKRSTLL